MGNTSGDERKLEERQITVICIGAGQRGNVYSQYAKDFPNRMKVVGVAEPRDTRRIAFQRKYDLDNENVFTDWRDVIKREKFADAVIIATLDDMHYEPCIAFANLKYQILCEKPMAPTEKECIEMVEAAKENGIILAFGHVLRYTDHNMKVKKLIDDGAIGDVVGINHTEPVGWWHFAHSFVRGNWNREVADIGSLMAKSCHDLDLIKYFLGNKRCKKIQSFGKLNHFTKSNKPKEASDRCLDCSIEPSCPYSAVKQYLVPVRMEFPDAFCYAVTDTPDIENMTKALREGPYGKCVYDSENDVCDYQIVNMEFEDCKYVNFTMSAFTKAMCSRKIQIYGTMGQIEMNGSSYSLFDFRTEKNIQNKFSRPEEPTNMSGHGFSDYHLMKAFVKAVSLNDPSIIQSGPEDSLRGHKLVFAAERSRKQGGVMLDVDI